MTRTKRGNHNFDDEQQQEQETLNQVIADIAVGGVEGERSDAYSMILAIRRMIHQFKLQSRLHPYEVLNIAYLRAIAAIAAKKTILDYRAWLKGTAFNIVRERARQLGKETLTDPYLTDQLLPTPEDLETADEQVEQVFKAFEQLCAENREVAELLYWRLIEKLSWAKIHDRLQKRDGVAPSLEALRQKASRAKTRLRYLFHSLDNRCSTSRR
ncbi:MAG: hypothetical protein VKJ24_04475 [Synechococcales bacterium]|nr:hypothetical protein [Synechococcales bacterium]